MPPAEMPQWFRDRVRMYVGYEHERFTDADIDAAAAALPEEWRSSDAVGRRLLYAMTLPPERFGR